MTRPLAFDELLDTRCLAQLEQVGLLELFELEHFANASIGAVASDKFWTLIYGQALEQSHPFGAPSNYVATRMEFRLAAVGLGLTEENRIKDRPVEEPDIATAGAR